MTERPILFSGPMVRALLDGTKTQTRRVIKRQPWASCSIEEGYEGESPFVYSALHGAGPGHDVDESRTPCVCPYGQPGDKLWVRETWSTHAFLDDVPPSLLTTRSLHYWADGHVRTGKVRSSIHMPRWASRILLEITCVRVERLQDISEADARAEGVTIEERHTVGYCAGEFLPPSIRAYRELWEAINGPQSWDANPWVWVVDFRRIDR